MVGGYVSATKFYRHESLIKKNDMILQFSARNIDQIWRNITDYLCPEPNKLNIVSVKKNMVRGKPKPPLKVKWSVSCTNSDKNHNWH
jgi:hypothetical protein